VHRQVPALRLLTPYGIALDDEFPNPLHREEVVRGEPQGAASPLGALGEGGERVDHAAYAQRILPPAVTGE